MAIFYRSRVVSISGLTTVILNSAMMAWSKASRVEEQMGSRCSFVNISFRSELQLRLYSSALQSVTVCFIATMLNVSMLLLLPNSPHARTLLGYKKQKKKKKTTRVNFADTYDAIATDKPLRMVVLTFITLK